MVTLKPEGPQAVGHTAPNLSVITIDVDMEGDTEVVGTQDATVTTSGYQNGARQQDRQKATTSQLAGTNERELEEGWKRDAVTMTEEDYIRTKQKPPTRGSPWICTLDYAQGASSAYRSYWP